MTTTRRFNRLDFTAIPNVFFKHWMHKLPPSVGYVLLAIARQTYGWQKEEDAISLTQISEMTGMSRNTVIKGIAVLEEHELILCSRKQIEGGCNETNIYRIWFEEQDEGSANPAPPPSANPEPGVVQNLHPQKKASSKQKETTTEKSASRVVVPFWFEGIGTEQTYGQLLKAFPVEAIEAACELLTSQGHSPGNVYGWISDCIRGEWKPTPSSADLEAANVAILKSKFNGLKNKRYPRAGVMVEVGHNYVQFNSEGQGKLPVKIACSEQNFEGKVRAHVKMLLDFEKGG